MTRKSGLRAAVVGAWAAVVAFSGLSGAQAQTNLDEMGWNPWSAIAPPGYEAPNVESGQGGPEGSCVNCGPCDVPEGEVVCFDEYDDCYNTGCNGPTNTPPCTAPPEPYSTILCGQTVCGTYGNFLNGGAPFRDTDWYHFTLAAVSDVTITVTGEAQTQVALLAGACPPSVIAGQNVDGPACTPITVSATGLAPGTYTLFVSIPFGFTAPCGAKYRATLTTTTCNAVTFYSDPGAFATAAGAAGKSSKFSWNFDPHDDDPDDDDSDMDDPLDINTHDDAGNPEDPWTDGMTNLWPPEVDNVQFTANTTPGAVLTPRGDLALQWGEAGTFGPTNILVANFFVDSFNIISGPPAGDSHTGLALELVNFSTSPSVTVTVYDTAGNVIGTTVVSATAAPVFLGILTNGAVIGRVEIYNPAGSSAEGIASIQAYACGCPDDDGDGVCDADDNCPGTPMGHSVDGDGCSCVQLAPPGAPTDVYVDDDWAMMPPGSDPNGPGDPPSCLGYDGFAKVQDAVNAVAPGGTVHVAPGTYTGSSPVALITTDNITLSGANAGNDARVTCDSDGARGPESILDGMNTDSVIEIHASGVTIDGFKIMRGDGGIYSSGVWMSNLEGDNHILNNWITDNRYGVYANCASASEVRYNFFDDNNRPGYTGTGMYADSTVSLTVAENEFSAVGNVTDANWPVIFEAAAPPHSGLVFTLNNVHDNDDSGIYFTTVNGATISKNTLQAPTGAFGGGTALQLIGACTAINVTENAFSNSVRGLRVQDFGNGPNSDVHINGNSFVGFLGGAANYAVGVPVAGGHTGTLDASANWWDSNVAATVVSKLDTTGGAIDYTPWLDVGTDIGGDPCDGFQGSFSTLWVDDDSPQTGSDGRIQEGVNLVTASTVNVLAGTYTETVLIGKKVSIIGEVDMGGDSLVTVQPPSAGVSLFTINGTGFGGDETVRIENIDMDGLAGMANVGLSVPATADFVKVVLKNGDLTGFTNFGVGIFGNGTTGLSVEEVELDDLTFSNNGIAGGGGNGDVQMFEYNGDATLTGLTLVGNRIEAPPSGARLGIQFRGVGAGTGVGVLPMGNVSLSNIDITGKYRNQFIGIQRYTTATTLSLSNVVLGSSTSEITGTFGALLRFDAVGTGTVAASATVDLNDTYFRGTAVASTTKNDLEFAPDNTFTFLRADATDTRWDVNANIGVLASALTLTEAFAVEDRILHYVEPLNLGQPYKGWAEVQNGKAFVTDTFASVIQRGVEVVDAAGTVHVDGTFDEDVNVNRADLKLVGTGVATAMIRGVIGGPDGATVRVSANGVEVEGFTITRNGNNTADWNNAGLNSAGVAIIGTALTAMNIHDNLITGNRTGIDINNSSGHDIRNNVITDNHTGMIMRNVTDNTQIIENDINNNRTVGVLFLDASGGTNVPVQSALGCTIRNNNLSANWYGQIVDRQSGGVLPVPGTTNLKNFSGNWYGTLNPVITTANSAEPGYSVHIPVHFGGTATPPGGQPDVAGPASANFDITPYLSTGTDTSVDFGFQGDYSDIVVTDDIAQTGAMTRFDEAIGEATDPGTIRIADGAYTGDLDTTTKSLTIKPGTSPALVTINGNLALDSNDTAEFELTGATPGTDYDQLDVNGTVSLGSALLDVALDYSRVFGTSYTLIDNDSNDPVSGIFVDAATNNPLPEGATFVISGTGGSKTVRITYVGGDGNDVVLLFGPGTLELVFDDDCYASGEILTATLRMKDLSEPAAGFQAFLAYDSALLTFNTWAYTANPFGQHILNSLLLVNPAVGQLDLAAGIIAGSQSPSQADADLVTLTFTVNAAMTDCTVENLLVFRDGTANPPTAPSRLTDDNGVSFSMTLIDAPTVAINNTPPTFTPCPPGIVHTPTLADISADCLDDDVVVPTPTATAFCGCGPVTVIGIRSDDPNYPGGPPTIGLNDGYSPGVTTIQWTATDSVGNVATCIQTVTINAVEISTTVEIAPAIDPTEIMTTPFTFPLKRCIRFEVECGIAGSPWVVDKELAFNAFAGGGAIAAPVDICVPKDPMGPAYDCMTARDMLHTLRSTAPITGAGPVVFAASFTGKRSDEPPVDMSGGHRLVPGNYNDDRFIDILDFGIWAGTFDFAFPSPGVGYEPGDTPCGTPFPHADSSGDGRVQIRDFNHLQFYFLMSRELDCCGNPFEGGGEGPITRITVRELHARGMGAAAAGDVNQDGVLDMADVAEVLNGTPPTPPADPSDPVTPIGPVPPGDVKRPPDTGTGGTPPPVGRRP